MKSVRFTEASASASLYGSALTWNIEKHRQSKLSWKFQAGSLKWFLLNWSTCSKKKHGNYTNSGSFINAKLFTEILLDMFLFKLVAKSCDFILASILTLDSQMLRCTFLEWFVASFLESTKKSSGFAPFLGGKTTWHSRDAIRCQNLGTDRITNTSVSGPAPSPSCEAWKSSRLLSTFLKKNITVWRKNKDLGRTKKYGG